MNHSIIPSMYSVVWGIRYEHKGKRRLHISMGPTNREEVLNYIENVTNSSPRLPLMSGATMECEFEIEEYRSDEEWMKASEEHQMSLEEEE